ncbi:MAG TPA: acyl-CoA thioesterase domain-containing protein [Acidimicrobiales bacterium]|nr:acyl-CoA thioesterase domain-containing protein [Acidimicrobiales bacterium]
MVAVKSILESLHLEPAGEGRYRAENVHTGHPVVFGGQLLAQSIVAAAAGHEGKTVKTLHTVFARAAAPDTGVEITVDPVHAGRALASSTVTISQGARICTRSMVLMSAEEPDLIRHADPAPAVAAPDAGPSGDDWAVQIVDGVDLSDPAQVGPPELQVWTAFPGAPEEAVTSQALLAFATDGFLIGTAMRPHEGVGQAQAHVTLSTGVLGHTITFHEPFSAASWLLLAHRSVHAGHGRSYGRADVFATDGTLVASFVQDSMIRAMAERKSGAAPL